MIWKGTYSPLVVRRNEFVAAAPLLYLYCEDNKKPEKYDIVTNVEF